MVQVNFAEATLRVKLVYYGPGMSGKTTNLRYLHKAIPQELRGELISIATEGDRTLVFDFLPVEVGKIGNLEVKFQIYTVPGQPFYRATRKFVLQGADGVVFVADSQKGRMRENLETLLELFQNLKEEGKSLQEIPLVMQWNKRDLPDIVPVSVLEQKLNLLKVPSFEAVATKGEGVFESLSALLSQCLENLKKEFGGELRPVEIFERASAQPQRERTQEKRSSTFYLKKMEETLEEEREKKKKTERERDTSQGPLPLSQGKPSFLFLPSKKSALKEEGKKQEKNRKEAKKKEKEQREEQVPVRVEKEEKREKAPLSQQDVLLSSSSSSFAAAATSLKLNSKEALDQLWRGGVLEGVELECLDLRGLTFPRSLCFRHCRIDRILGSSVECEQEVRFENCQIGEMIFSQDAKASTPPSRFKEGLRLIRTELEKGDFRGAVFSGPVGWAYVKVPEEGLLSFYGAHFFAPFGFRECTLPALDLREVHFYRHLFWENTHFLGSVNAYKTIFEGKFILERMTFSGKLLLLHCQFHKLLEWRNSTFENTVYLGNSSFFGDFLLFDDEFLAEVLLQGSQLKGDLNISSIFKREVYVRNTEVAGILDLSTSIFESKLSLVACQLGQVVFTPLEVKDLVICWKEVEGKLKSEEEGNFSQAVEEYLLLRKHFEERGQKRDSDAAYVAMRRAKRCSLAWERPLEAVQRCFDWLFLDLCLGYGTKPFRLISLGVGVVLLFGLFYFLQPYGNISHVKDSRTPLGFLEAMVLSFSVFVGAYREWVFHPSSFVSFASSLEAFLGLVFSFLFVYLLLRRLLS